MLAVDAHRSFGQVAAKTAMQHAIEMAAETGLALVALRDSHHVGRIGHWAEQCAHAGFASLHFVNVVHSPPVVAPFGGREARLHTNPIAIGVPRSDAPPLILDFATSRVAQGKMRIAMARGVQVPEGYLIDSTGQPTTDPAAAYGTDTRPAGSLLPFGTYKGFGLGLMCDLLAGAIGGGRALHPDTTKDGIYVNNMLSFVFDVNRLSDPLARNREISAVIDYVLSCAQSDDGPVRMPGAASRKQKKLRTSRGIPIDIATWRMLDEIFVRYRVDRRLLRGFSNNQTLPESSGHPSMISTRSTSSGS